MDLGLDDRDDFGFLVYVIGMSSAAMDLGLDDRDDAMDSVASGWSYVAAMDLGLDDRDDLADSQFAAKSSRWPQWISVWTTETT